MTLEQLIYEKISYLSSGQRKVAEYILQNLDSFSYATLAKLSKEISVSETTIIRLAYALGFDSFSAMQQQIRAEILTTPKRNIDEALQSNSFYQSVFSKEISSLEKWAAHVDEKLLDSTVARILNADKILVVGARSSFSAASWLGSCLNNLLANVFVIREFYDSRMDLITDITPESIVLCISFARYSKWTYLYSEIAKKHGAGIITITDSISSPLVDISDLTLLVDSNKDHMGLNSFVCLYCLFNALIAKISAETHEAIATRLKNYEKIYQDFDLFFE